ncbi:hypothetical protein QMO14_32145, partial [Variovorax sp. CAN2819]|nr:hypothetical protein [Variovorax sp. CAN15]
MTAAARDYLAAKDRWHNELAAFARADQERFPAPGGVMFVGSSPSSWLTEVATDCSSNLATADSGTSAVAVLLSTLPENMTG